MQAIRNFGDVHQVLREQTLRTADLKVAYTLDRMRQLMAALGNPQNSYRVIHVAGTSGKTSTCYYIAALLHAAGNKVGLTVSPHVDEVNERVQIDMQALPEADFCKRLSTFIAKVEATEITPTYFELLVAFAYWTFAEEKVDFAVVETGLGGLLDGTNVVTQPGKFCVITDIGLDHTATLGNTIGEIARQKAGIIQPNNSLFMYKQSGDVMSHIRRAAHLQHAIVHEITDASSHPPLDSSVPIFQQRNWRLARFVYDAVAQDEGWAPLTSDQLLDTQNTYIPARMEVQTIAGKSFVMDGAHNAQKLQALTTSLQARFPDQYFAILLGFGEDKQDTILAGLEVLLPLASHVIVTNFDAGQDVPKKSMDPHKVLKIIRQLGFASAEVIANPKVAFDTLQTLPEPVLLATGSFYLLNHIRPLLNRVRND